MKTGLDDTALISQAGHQPPVSARPSGPEASPTETERTPMRFRTLALSVWHSPLPETLLDLANFPDPACARCSWP